MTIKKKQFVKEKINFEFQNDKNPYIGRDWFIIPNDSYISSVNNLTEYENKSSTSDFKAFEVWGSGLLNGQFESTLESAEVIFKKNGLTLNWHDEIFLQAKNDINHTLIINDKLYQVFEGTLTRDNMGEIIHQYVKRLKEIFNDVITNQNKDFSILLITQPETINFILLANNKLVKFKKIIEKCKNKIES